MALTVSRLGMSLIQMGGVSESVRFLDDVDLTFSLDSRSSSSHQMTSIEVGAKPITFRASYRDINLITSIVNKAIEGYGNSQQSLTNQSKDVSQSNSSQNPEMSVVKSTNLGKSRQDGKARVSLSKEQVFVKRGLTKTSGLINNRSQFKGSFDGFRLVLIGDLHEQPMLHLRIKPFIVGAKDWSGEVSHNDIRRWFFSKNK